MSGQMPASTCTMTRRVLLEYGRPCSLHGMCFIPGEQALMAHIGSASVIVQNADICNIPAGDNEHEQPRQVWTLSLMPIAAHTA